MTAGKMTVEFETGDESNSRANQLIQEIKRRKIASGQFRMGWVLCLMVATAAVAVAPRYFGAQPFGFFLMLAVVMSISGPVVALALNGMFPAFSKRHRMYLSIATLAILLASWIMLTYWLEGSLDDIVNSLGFLLGFWVGQGILIGLLWRFLFYEPKKAKR